MADLGTIGIAIEVRGKEALRQIETDMTAVDRTAKSAARSFEAFERAGLKTADTFRYMSEESRRRLQEESRITQEIVKQTKAAERLASANAKAFQANVGRNLGLGARGVSASASSSAYEAELERLRQKYDRVYSASKLYEEQLNEIRRAESLGAISTRQMQQELDKLNSEYQQFSEAAEGASIANNRFSQHVNEAGRGLNSFGMVTQQVGYQVGDFFVQIQSGTNPLVAFGQQATQLAGLIPGVLGAALGIGISLFTAVGAAIMRTSENTKTFQDSLSSLEGNLSSLNETVGSITVENYDRMLEKYSQLNQAIYDNIGNITALNAQLISIAQIDLSNLFSESFGGLLTNRIDEMRIAFETTNDQARVLLMMMDDVAMARGPDQLVQSMTALRDELIDTAGGINNLTTKQAEFVLEISNAIDKASMAKGRLEQMAAAAPDGTWMNPAIGGVDDLIGRINAALGRVDALRKNLKVTGAAAGNGGIPEIPGVQPLTGGQGTIDLSNSFVKVAKAASGAAKSISEAEKAAEALQKQLEAPLVSAVGSISDAFGDFVARGLSDFKGFVKSILGSFKNMIAQMIAMAVKNRIMLSLGIGGLTPTAAAAGQVAGVGSAGGMLGSFAGGGVAGTGFLGGFGAGMPSFLGGAGNGLFAVGANAAAAGGTFAATAGAIAAPLLAVAAVFSFFKKKTKELDAGLRISVTNMDAFVKSFQTIQTKRFWGLSKKTTTTESEVSAEISDPIVEAVQKMQTQIVKAAELFGISSDAFDNFVYDFEVSLKGLTEEQKIQKVNEEILKMGDAFTALSGKFTSMNELLLAAQERYDLTTRLLQAQGKEEELLTRQRELELAVVQDVNKELLEQVQAQEEANRIAEQTREIERQALAAAEEAARLLKIAEGQALAISKEKSEIELQLLIEQGKAAEALAAQRQKELDALDETNRALLQQVFDQQDWNKAQEEASRIAAEAAQIAEEAAQKAKAIAEERSTVEIKLLELQGKATEALATQRAKELDALDETNRALLQQVFDQEDLNKAQEEANRVAEEAKKLAEEKTAIELKLLELQGKANEALTLQREKELAAVDESNKELLKLTYAMEDYNTALSKTMQAVEESTRVYEGALSDLRQAMDREMSAAQSALDNAQSVLDNALQNQLGILKGNLSSAEDAVRNAQQSLEEAQRREFEATIRSRITAVNNSFVSLISSIEQRLEVAQQKAEASRRIFEVLDSALQERRLVTAGREFASRQAALSYVSGGGSDPERLSSALSVLNEPTEQLFSSFQDYARDFALTTNAIQESRDLAEATMTADEKMVVLLEQQLESSRVSQEAQVAALEKLLEVQEDFLTVTEATQQLLEAQETYDQAKIAHEELLAQYPQLQETFITVGDALAQYLAAQATFDQVQKQHEELLAQFTGLNETLLTVAQATANLNSAITAQSAAQQAQAAAQEALAKAIADAAAVSVAEAVPAFAYGGMHSGGMRLVGENGPELEVTGPSRIYSNRDTASMFRDPELAGAVDGLRREVSGMRSEQLQLQVEISKNVKRVYDIERKWDTDGLPPERV